jgi:hypothetical protein
MMFSAKVPLPQIKQRHENTATKIGIICAAPRTTNCLTVDLPFNSAYRHAAWISFLSNHSKLQQYLL